MQGCVCGRKYLCECVCVHQHVSFVVVRGSHLQVVMFVVVHSSHLLSHNNYKAGIVTVKTRAR